MFFTSPYWVMWFGRDVAVPKVPSGNQSPCEKGMPSEADVVLLDALICSQSPSTLRCVVHLAALCLADVWVCEWFVGMLLLAGSLHVH